MIEAKCKDTCYDSTSCRRYEKDKVYLLDEGMINAFYARHFELPKDAIPKEAAEENEAHRRKRAEKIEQ